MSSSEAKKNWDLVIESKAKLFDLNLKEVWRYRDLLFLFVKRDFAAQYKQTILGPLWHFIQPLFTTLIFYFVFTRIAHISTDGLPAVLFYMTGITLWNFFAGCLNSTSNTFVANAGIFGKVYFPRLVIPVSTVFSNLIKFGIQLLLLAVLIIYYIIFRKTTLHPGYYLLLVPIVLFIMAGIGLGVGIIVSSLTTKYRDLTILVGFGVQLLMYATPVIYPISVLTQSGKFLMQFNPLAPLIESFRLALLGKGDFNWLGLLYSVGFMAVVLFLGVMIFSKVEKSFMDTV